MYFYKEREIDWALQELEGDEVIGEVLAEFEAEHLAGLRTRGAVLLSDRHVDLLDENLGVQVLCQNINPVFIPLYQCT